MQLYEKYRPKTLTEFIGQLKVTKALGAITKRPGWDQDAFWIQGPSGTGKTSLALIIASQVAHDLFIEELDGDKCNVDAVRELEQTLTLIAPDSWRVVIVNEAHAMSRKAVQAWLTLLERLPKHTLIIFTTTEPLQADLFGNFSSPFASRCKVFSFTNQGLAQAMAQRAKVIAQAEGLDGQPLPKYVRLVQDCKNNMRQVLQRIDACEML